MNTRKSTASRITVRGDLQNIFLPSIALFAGVFLFISASKIDLLSIFSLDDIFGSKSFAFSPYSATVRVLSNFIFAAAVAAFVSSVAIQARRQRHLSESESSVSTINVIHNSSESKNDATALRDAAITSLNKRIAALNLRATTIYWTMIIALVTGVILIIFAGYLSSFDTTVSNLSSKIDSDRQDAIQTLGRFFQQSRQSPSNAITALTVNPPSALDNNSYDYAFKRVQAIDQNYTSLVGAMIHDISDRADNKPVWNWPSTILRVGVIGLLVFLTQILISLFRYNSRLIAFYGSRRDALILATNPSELEALAKLFFPANLDFGKEPRHTFQEIGELISKSSRRLTKPANLEKAGRKKANGGQQAADSA